MESKPGMPMVRSKGAMRLTVSGKELLSYLSNMLVYFQPIMVSASQPSFEMPDGTLEKERAM